MFCQSGEISPNLVTLYLVSAKFPKANFAQKMTYICQDGNITAKRLTYVDCKILQLNLISLNLEKHLAPMGRNESACVWVYIPRYLPTCLPTYLLHTDLVQTNLQSKHLTLCGQNHAVK